MTMSQRIGWRSYVSPLSSLLTSIYGVWNAETTSTTLATSVYSAWNGEGTVTATQLTTSASNAWNAEGTGTLLDASIYSYWSGENVTTDLINGNNGTLMSGATFSTGKIGKAFSFNGSNSYLKLPNNSLNFTGDFSISCWVNVSGISVWPQYIYAFGNLQNSGSNYFGYRLFIYGNAYAFDICNGTTTISGYQSASTQGLFYGSGSDTSAQIAPVAGGAWKHVVITRKAGTGTKMYINGVLKTSNTSTVDPVYTTTHTPSIGAQIMNSGNSFGGATSLIDLTSTWTKELSADEVLSLYNFGNATEYTYSTKTLPSAKDSIGTKNGTLMNGTTFTTGKLGISSFLFDGINDYVALPNNSMNLTGDFTVSTWVNFSSLPSASTIISNYYRLPPYAVYYGWSVLMISNQIAFDIFTGVNNSYVRLLSPSIPTNTWKHVTLIHKKNVSLSIYIDGVLSVSTATTFPIGYSGNETPAIGGTLPGDGFQYPTNGKIDSLSVWNRELTSIEISALYNSGTGQQYPFSTITVGTPTDSVSTNNGTIVGGVTYTQGVVGNAFTFNGSSNYISLPNSSFDFTGDFSISTWVKIPSAPTVAGQIFANYNYDFISNYGYNLGVNTNRTISFGVHGAAGSSVVTSTTALALNTWYHVTVKRDSVTKRSDLYINGVFEAQSPVSSVTIAYGPRAIQPTIGAIRQNNQGTLSTNSYLNGSVDALTIWNKKVSDDEIVQLYNMGGGIQYPFTTQTIKAPYAVYNGENLNDSVGTNNLTVGAGTVTYTTGKVGNAFTLAAGQLNFPTNSMQFSSSFSYAFWIKYTGTSPLYNGLFTAGGNQSKFGYSMYNYSGSLYTRFGDGTTVNNDMRVVLNPSFSFVVNTWYHIAVVFNAGSSAQVYANGQLLQSVNHTMAAVTYDSTRPNPIFGNNPGAGAYGTMTGQVDGLTFWNSALTAPEVLTLFNDGTGMEYPYSSTLPAKLPSFTDVFTTNHGTSPATSTPTFTVGKVGKAYNFDGINDYVELPSNSLNSLTGNFSISMWVKWGRNNISQILIANLNTNYGLGFFVEHAAGQLRFKGYKSAATNAFYAVKNSYTPTVGIWYHYTFTHKDQVNNIYENGVLIASDTTTTGHINHGVTNWPTIGANKYNSTSIQEPFQGAIDMVNIWSKELSAAEVTDLYNSGNGKQYPNY
jgi:hypothetical protein